MSLLPALITVILVLFWAGQVRAQTPEPGAAWADFCAAARAGDGPAQLYIGRALTDEKAEEAAGGRNMAAGMLWLDAAISSGAEGAKEARMAAGRQATPKDFERYRLYNNSRHPVPCEPEE